MRGGYRDDFQGGSIQDKDDYYTKQEPDLTKVGKDYSDDEDSQRNGGQNRRGRGLRGGIGEGRGGGERGRGGGGERGRGGGRGGTRGANRGNTSNAHNQRNAAYKKTGGA